MSSLTQDTPIEETPAPAKQSISTKLFFLVVGWGIIYTLESLVTNLSGGIDVTDEVWATLR